MQSNFCEYLWICMLLIHETIRLACSIATLCLYTCVYIVYVFSFIGICPFKRSKSFYDHQHFMKIFWSHYHLSVSLFLSCLKAQRRKKLKSSSPEKKKVHRHIYICTYIYMHTGTYIYVHIHTHIYISGALAQLTLKNYTSNRLREDNKLNVCLLPQWMHRASVLRPQWSEEDWEHEECDHLFY